MKRGPEASPGDGVTVKSRRLPTRDVLFTGLFLGVLVFAGLAPIWTLVLQSVIERLLPPAGPRKSFRSWLLHFQINIFFNGVLILFTVVAFVSCSKLANHVGFGLGVFDIRFGSPKEFVVLLASLWLASILSDFFFYWYHRSLHVNEFLWQHHKMHHTDTELEAVSTARQNWIEAVFVSLFITIPMIILFKVNPSDQWNVGILAGISASSLITVLSLSHMNVRWHVGWASVLWCSPQIHRIHHSLEARHVDKNFAFMFPMWDVIFGTYYHPKADEFPVTGVVGESGFDTFLGAQIYTQREWWKFIKKRRFKIATTKR